MGLYWVLSPYIFLKGLYPGIYTLTCSMILIKGPALKKKVEGEDCFELARDAIKAITGIKVQKWQLACYHRHGYGDKMIIIE